MFARALQRLLQLVNNKLLVKLVLAYSAIMLVPLLVTIHIVTNSVNSKLLDVEVQRQEEILETMKSYLNEQYNKVNLAIYYLYYTVDGTDSPVDHLVRFRENGSDYNTVTRNVISGYLNGISLSRDEIVDIILLDTRDKPGVFSTSDRSISNNFDFSALPALRSIAPTDKRTRLFADDSPDYILGDARPVISHVGNLYDLNNAQLRAPVGRYLINLSSAEIARHYDELSDSSRAAFYMLQEDGTVLSSNRPEDIGRAHPFFDRVSTSAVREVEANGEVYIVNKTRLAQRGITLLIQVPKAAVLEGTNQLVQDIFAVFLAGVMLMLLLSGLFSSYIAFKVKTLYNAMRAVERGNFHAVVKTESNDEFGQLTASFNRMCIRLEEYVNKVYIAEIQSKSAKLSSLQSAINPHFLYNTIESIRMKALEERSKDTPHMLYMLGKLFHWRISSERSIITIEEELESIDWYLSLMNFRFANNLETKIQVDESLYEYCIPKLLLQPIIENAFQHGLFRKQRRAVLSIRGTLRDRTIVFDIADNGIGIGEERLRALRAGFDRTFESAGAEHIGLANVFQRVHVLFGSPHTVRIESKEQYWTKVSVSIPALHRKEMEARVPSMHY